MTYESEKEKRSKIMSAVRSVSKLESEFAHALWRKGIRYRRNVRTLLGTPDIVIKKYKIVIFIDSCFWHGCPIHFKPPKTNREFWNAKIEKNKSRDKAVTEYYTKQEWNIKRIWEHSIRKNVDFEDMVNETFDFINHLKKEQKQ